MDEDTQPATPSTGAATWSGSPRLLGERYRCDELLGQGGAADVYRATDEVLRREVAIKVLRSSAEDEIVRARFATEAHLLAQLSHPGIVTLLDAGMTEEQPYLVTELVHGSTLGRELRGGAMPIERVATIGIQLAEALAYAHARGIVHRDVKPSNVLMGADGRVKLADFGIARLIGDTSHHTQTGQTIGTAAYLSPEQVTGGEVGGPADVYSLGLVLLEAATGIREYPGTPTESAVARLVRPPRVPTSLPPELRVLLTRTACVDPADRPSAADVARVLRGWQADPTPYAALATGDLATVATAPAAAALASMAAAASTATVATPAPLAGLATPATAASVAALAAQGPPQPTGVVAAPDGHDTIAVAPVAPVTPGAPVNPGRRRRIPVLASIAAAVIVALVAIAIGASHLGSGSAEAARTPGGTPESLTYPLTAATQATRAVAARLKAAAASTAAATHVTSAVVTHPRPVSHPKPRATTSRRGAGAGASKATKPAKTKPAKPGTKGPGKAKGKGKKPGHH